MEARAVARYIRMSPRKVRLVADVVKGRPVQQALDLLRFMPKAAAAEVAAAIRSAVANAEQNLHLSAEDLYVLSIVANEGPRMKRYRPRAHGRVGPVLKRSTHIDVTVGEKEE